MFIIISLSNTLIITLICFFQSGSAEQWFLITMPIRSARHYLRFGGDGPPGLGKEEIHSRSRQTRGGTAKAKAAPKQNARGRTTKGEKAPSNSGRRIVTEHYTSQVLVEDFVDAELYLLYCQRVW